MRVGQHVAVGDGVDRLQDLLGHDVRHRLGHQRQHAVAGQGGDERVKVVEVVEQLDLDVRLGVVLHEGGEHLALGAARGQPRHPLGEDRLERGPGVEQLGVGRAAEVEVQRGGAREVARVEGSDERTAAGAALDVDDALDLEQAQRLAQRLAADLVPYEHLGLGQESVTDADAAREDVVDDAGGRGLGGLRGSAPRVLGVGRGEAARPVDDRQAVRLVVQRAIGGGSGDVRAACAHGSTL